MLDHGTLEEEGRTIWTWRPSGSGWWTSSRLESSRQEQRRQWHSPLKLTITFVIIMYDNVSVSVLKHEYLDLLSSFVPGSAVSAKI